MAFPWEKLPKRFSLLTVGSDDDSIVLCQPCDIDGHRVPAHCYCVDCREHLCHTCCTLHRRHTLSRHHTLLDKDSMPQTMSTASAQPSPPDNLTKPCPKHTKEMIKFYCQTHEILLCSVCVTLEHTGTSCKVNYIPDISDQVINSKVQDMLKAMDTVTEQCCKNSEDERKIPAMSNPSLAEKSLKQQCPPPAADIKSKQTSCQDEICVKTSKDEGNCLIAGMTLLTPYLLIITDHYNNAVKMVDTCSQSVTDQLQLDTVPCDVTSVTRTELAVTLPNKQYIQFISVSLNKLEQKQTVKVDGKCRGISYCQGKLVVSFAYPAKLQIIDTNGTVWTTVEGESIFSMPLYVATNTNSIHVSDCDKGTITRLSWQGKVIGSYGVDRPHGITLSDAGTVFVCENRRKVIEEIARGCSTGKIVLKDLNGPYAVCWCAETNKLYYSCYTEQGKHYNYLQVYKLSLQNSSTF